MISLDNQAIHRCLPAHLFGDKPMSHLSRRALLQAGAVVLPLSFAGRSFSQDKFPSKPVTLIVPQPAGGDADVVCRSIQTKMQEVLGQAVVIDNRAGAGGNIGTALGAKAAP